jgi:large subunit ribosomal protein L21
MAGFLLLQSGSVPIWVILAIILVIVLMFWWGLTRKSIAGEEPAAADHSDGHATDEMEILETSEADVELESAAVETVVEEETFTADNLQRIEGIGPKTEALLNEAGIATYDQLAETDVAELERIVREEAGIRVADPRTWPAQAAFAAKGDWAGLDAYQKRLMGGREQGV